MNKLIRILLAFTALSLIPQAIAAAQVIATVGDESITAKDLDRAIASSPFAVGFPSMDQDAQAALRGDLLKRLVASRLLYLEALRLGLDADEAFRKELALTEDQLLYRAYIEDLRGKIQVPDDELQRMQSLYGDDPDAFAAARARYVSDQYKARKNQVIARLKNEAKLVLHEQRVAEGAASDTIVAEGKGIAVSLGDLVREDEFNRDLALLRLDELSELKVVSLAARRAGFDVAGELESFRRERLPALLLSRKAGEWVPSEEAARNYLKAHRSIGDVPEQRHVLQIVVSEQEEAEALRKRVLGGESFYRLAAEHSIDPYGRKNAGDMGWLKAGSGMPAIEEALAELPLGQVSDVIETTRGYHLVRVEAKRPAQRKRYEEIADRVQQAMLNEGLRTFVGELEDRFSVEWKLPMASSRQAGDAAEG